jgi:signal peptidase II
VASVDADPADAPTDARTRRVRHPVAAICAVAALVVGLDQLTKWRAVEELGDGRVVDLFWTLRFRLVYNRGTAFSLTEDTGLVVSVIAIVVVLVLLRSGRNQRSPLVIVGYGMVVGGTVGNLVDRAFREGDGAFGGGVVDFVDPQWFPVFNVADSSLTIGIALLLVAGFFTDAFDDPEDQEPAAGDR